MFKKLSAFVLLPLHAYHARRDHQLAFMACQIKALRRRLLDKSFRPSPSARSNANPGSKACSSTSAEKPDNISGQRLHFLSACLKNASRRRGRNAFFKHALKDGEAESSVFKPSFSCRDGGGKCRS